MENELPKVVDPVDLKAYKESLDQLDKMVDEHQKLHDVLCELYKLKSEDMFHIETGEIIRQKGQE